jgi:hypothetical protein
MRSNCHLRGRGSDNGIEAVRDRSARPFMRIAMLQPRLSRASAIAVAGQSW